MRPRETRPEVRSCSLTRLGCEAHDVKSQGIALFSQRHGESHRLLVITVSKDLERFSGRCFRIRSTDFLHGRVGVQHQGAFVLGIKGHRTACGEHG
jgi:hypothetical protein